MNSHAAVKILVFIRAIPVLVTLDKNACYAFPDRTQSASKRLSRESYAKRSREFFFFPLLLYHIYKVLYTYLFAFMRVLNKLKSICKMSHHHSSNEIFFINGY